MYFSSNDFPKKKFFLQIQINSKTMVYIGDIFQKTLGKREREGQNDISFVFFVHTHRERFECQNK